MDPVDVLRRLGGVAAYGELIGGTTPRQLRTAVASGRVVRVRRDRYALVDVHAHRAAAVSAGGVLSHLSAALLWGWQVKHEPLTPWVTLPRNRRRPHGDLEVRWSGLTDADVVHHVTSPVRTVVDCAKALPFDEALAVADSALRSREVDRHQLLLAAQRSNRTGRSRAIEVIEEADPRAANPFESVLRAVARGVPGLHVVPQGEIPGVGRVDLWDEELGIVVEAESHQFHSTPAGLLKDVLRYTECARRDLVVVRFVWGQVMHAPHEVHKALVDVVLHRASRLPRMV